MYSNDKTYQQTTNIEWALKFEQLSKLSSAD